MNLFHIFVLFELIDSYFVFFPLLASSALTLRFSGHQRGGRRSSAHGAAEPAVEDFLQRGGTGDP